MGNQISSLFTPVNKIRSRNISDDIENYTPFSNPTNDSVVNAVILNFIARSEMGYKKYGVTLDRTDLLLKDWVLHAQEEMMDGILYLEKIKRTIDHTDNNVNIIER